MSTGALDVLQELRLAANVHGGRRATPAEVKGHGGFRLGLPPPRSSGGKVWRETAPAKNDLGAKKKVHGGATLAPNIQFS